MERKSKRGSVTVFVCLFFMTLVFLLSAFIEASKKTAVHGASEALCNLWADSVLAEYDLNLQRRYNVFGYYGYPADVNEKIDFYAKESFKEKRYINYGGCRSSLFPYSLINTECLKPQLVAAGKLAFTEKFIRPAREVKTVESRQPEQIPSAGTILAELPSAGSDRSISLSSVTDLLKSGQTPGELVKSGSDSYFLQQYIFAYFKDQTDSRELGKTYLENEIEYLICGKKSDAANASAIRSRIIAVREALNFLYINRDPQKSAAAMAAAQLLTPGPAAAATQKALLAAWALAESYNDYKLLLNGHKVSVMKSEATWAVDLDSVIANKADGYIFTGIEEGMSYEDHLKLFIYAVDENVRILRIMDLIQMNMRYMYYDDFLLREYNGGVQFTLSVNGEEYGAEKTY